MEGKQWTEDQVSLVEGTVRELRGEIERTFDDYPTKKSVLDAFDAKIEQIRQHRQPATAGRTG